MFSILSKKKPISSNLIILFNFLVVFYLVYADVIRDDGYPNYEGQFTVVHKGRMLRVLMFFNNVKRETCALHCVRHLRCKTINYNNAKKDCELTDEDFNEMNVDTITPGWYNYGTPLKVDGGWSSWSNITECTTTCGNDGTLGQIRVCDSPKPEHGGTDCQGIMRRTVKCNIQECPDVNFALNKKVSQSSTYKGMSQYSPLAAIDQSNSTYTCTYIQTNPWWVIDFGEVREIKGVFLHVPLSSRYYNHDLRVETRKSYKDKWTTCKVIGRVTEKVRTFKCNGQSKNAQFLKIWSNGKSYLAIYDMRIFGPEKN